MQVWGATGSSLSLAEAARVLSDFDTKDRGRTAEDRFREAQALGTQGLEEERESLRAALRTLVEAAPAGGVQLGILALDSKEAVAALGEWTRGLGLNRGLLTGADVDGVPVEVPGPVFVKYASSCGNAALRHDPENPNQDRGVQFSAVLPDESLSPVYGPLPLRLFFFPPKVGE